MKVFFYAFLGAEINQVGFYLIKFYGTEWKWNTSLFVELHFLFIAIYSTYYHLYCPSTCFHALLLESFIGYLNRLSLVILREY